MILRDVNTIHNFHQNITVETLQQQLHTQYTQLQYLITINHSITNNSQAYIQSQTSHTATQTESVTLTLENDIETIVVDQNPITDTYIQEIHDKFRTRLTQYSGMDPAARPKLT